MKVNGFLSGIMTALLMIFVFQSCVKEAAIPESKDVKVQLRTYCDGIPIDPIRVETFTNQDGACCINLIFGDGFNGDTYHLLAISNNVILANQQNGYFSGDLGPNGETGDLCLNSNATHFVITIVRDNVYFCAKGVIPC